MTGLVSMRDLRTLVQQSFAECPELKKPVAEHNAFFLNNSGDSSGSYPVVLFVRSPRSKKTDWFMEKGVRKFCDNSCTIIVQMMVPQKSSLASITDEANSYGLAGRVMLLVIRDGLQGQSLVAQIEKVNLSVFNEKASIFIETPCEQEEFSQISASFKGPLYVARNEVAQFVLSSWGNHPAVFSFFDNRPVALYFDKKAEWNANFSGPPKFLDVPANRMELLQKEASGGSEEAQAVWLAWLVQHPEKVYLGTLPTEESHPELHYNYGLFLMARGKTTEGVSSLYSAAAEGHSQALHELFEFLIVKCAFPAERDEYFEWLQKQFGNDFSSTIFRLEGPEGHCLRASLYFEQYAKFAVEGLEPEEEAQMRSDEQTGIEYLELAKEKDCLAAFLLLGEHYFRWGDTAKAEAELRAGGEKGNGDCMAFLYCMYKQWGVVKERAAVENCEREMRNLCDLERLRGFGIDIDENEASSSSSQPPPLSDKRRSPLSPSNKEERSSKRLQLANATNEPSS